VTGPASGFVPSRALRRAVLLACLLLVAGTAAGRLDLVVVAMPFALGTAWALRRRPAVPPVAKVAAGGQMLAEGGPFAATVSVGNADEVGYDLVVVRTRLSRWLDVPDADRPYAAVLPAGGIADVALAGTAIRWGHHAVGPAEVTAAACDALLVSRPVTAAPAGVKVYPLTEPFAADDAMPRAAGLVGAHRSRLRGDAGELAGVRQFGPGDRLRRIDWRVTLRTRQLHVASTLSDRDAEVVLLLDVLHEAGHSGGVRGAASVLDTTVRAAAGIAEHYLHRGDRVSLVEYGGRTRRLRPASGRRQYTVALEWLLDVAVAQNTQLAAGGFDPQLVPGNALAVVLTPLLDLDSAKMLARMARAARTVVAVDTLPPNVRFDEPGDWADVANRIWRLDRANIIGQLREHGVPVVAWAGSGSLDQVLRDVSRMAAAPKAVMR